MRGKMKDAEAEALLKLLRQEQEINDRLSAPKIHRRLPLPAIGTSGSEKSQQTNIYKRTDQTLECFGEEFRRENELPSDTKFFWTTAQDIDTNNNSRCSLYTKNIYVPSFSWRQPAVDVSCSKFNRYPSNCKSNGRSLPPLEIPASSSCNLIQRPSCPNSESPKFWDEWSVAENISLERRIKGSKGRIGFLLREAVIQWEFEGIVPWFCPGTLIMDVLAQEDLTCYQSGWFLMEWVFWSNVIHLTKNTYKIYNTFLTTFNLPLENSQGIHLSLCWILLCRWWLTTLEVALQAMSFIWDYIAIQENNTTRQCAMTRLGLLFSGSIWHLYNVLSEVCRQEK